MTSHPKPPPVSELSYEQYSGRSCCWCGTPLRDRAVAAGVSCGRQGAHVLDTEVFACPDCAAGLYPSNQPGRNLNDGVKPPA